MALTVWVESSPFRIVGSEVQRRYKRYIVDEHVYDCGDHTYPSSTSGYSIGVSGVTASQLVEVLHNGEVVQTLSGRSSYIIPIVANIGDNSIQARSNGDLSNLIRFSTDNIQTVIYPYVEVLESEEERVRQAWANGFLATGEVADSRGGVLDPSLKSLIETWGEWLNAPRVSGYTASEYIELLRVVLGILQRGAHEQSLIDVGDLLGTSGSSFHRLTDQVHTMGKILPRVFQGDNQCGSDLFSGWDFAHNWVTTGDVLVLGSAGFSTTGLGGMYVDKSEFGLETGKPYRLRVTLGVTGGTVTISTNGSNVLSGAGSGFYESLFNYVGDDFYIMLSASGSVEISSMQLYEIPVLTVYPGKIWLDNRAYNIPYTTIMLSGDTDTDQTAQLGELFVLVDPGVGEVNGSLTPIILTGEPSPYSRQYLETITSGRVQTDTTGGITGIINGKYVELERVPVSITRITGSSLILGAQCSRILPGHREQNSAVVDLGTRVSLDVLFSGTTGIGIVYRARPKPYVRLARVVCNLESTSNTVMSLSKICSSNRPSYGAINIPIERFYRTFCLLVERLVAEGAYTLPEKRFIQSVVGQLAPVGGMGHLFFSQRPWEDPYWLDDGGLSVSFWCRAQSLSGQTHESRVSSWPSVIGVVTGVQGTAQYQPHHITGATPLFASAVRFGGLNSDRVTYLELPSGLTTGVSGYSVFAVARTLRQTGDTQSLFYSSVSGGTEARLTLNRWRNNRNQVGAGGRRLDSDSLQTIAGGEIVLNQYSVDGVVVDYENRCLTIYQNGVVINQLVPFQTTGISDSGGSAYMLIGAGPAQVSPLLGDVIEIIAFSQALTDAQAVRVSNFLHRVALGNPVAVLTRAFQFYGSI